MRERPWSEAWEGLRAAQAAWRLLSLRLPTPLSRGARWAGLAGNDLEPLALGLAASEGVFFKRLFVVAVLGMVPSYVQLCLLNVRPAFSS